MPVIAAREYDIAAFLQRYLERFVSFSELWSL